MRSFSGSRAAAAAVYHRSVEELKIGDFVLFRETGNSDIIRFIAEDGMGAKEYGSTPHEGSPLADCLGTDRERSFEDVRP